jgi:hypothetical protein
MTNVYLLLKVTLNTINQTNVYMYEIVSRLFWNRSEWIAQNLDYIRYKREPSMLVLSLNDQVLRHVRIHVLLQWNNPSLFCWLPIFRHHRNVYHRMVGRRHGQGHVDDIRAEHWLRWMLFSISFIMLQHIYASLSLFLFYPHEIKTLFHYWYIEEHSILYIEEHSILYIEEHSILYIEEHSIL